MLGDLATILIVEQRAYVGHMHVIRLHFGQTPWLVGMHLACSLAAYY